MYTTIKHTRQFSLDTPLDRDEYDSIINNPLCTILEKSKEKLRDEEQEGETRRVTERIVLLVTWQEKKLC